MGSPEVAIIMGSDSDLPTMKMAAVVCDRFGIDFDLAIVSAHRTPMRMVQYAQRVADRGVKVVIAGAGGAAHLPGMVASITPLPVIGVPIRSKTMQGIDSLYSIVQMPAGVPVATVAIGNAENAGLLAVQILAVQNSNLMNALVEYRQELQARVMEKNERLNTRGYHSYFDG